MKHITLDFETYEKELEAAQQSGFESGKLAAVNLLINVLRFDEPAELYFGKNGVIPDNVRQLFKLISEFKDTRERFKTAAS